jgi:DNA-binding Lrp family transcriptional regulator
MKKELTKRNKITFEDKVLQTLIEDPTESIREIANDLESYRQKVWRKKKNFEDEKVIWGYTAVIDESKIEHVMYLVLMKLKPMSKELVDILIKRVVKKIPQKQRVRLLNVLYINGQYDVMIMFSAPDHAVARRYYDSLRITYEEYLLDKPVIVDVNFSIIREGKINPDLKGLYEFVPD